MAKSKEKFHPTTKRDVIEMLERMADDVTLDDMMYALYVRQRIDAGVKELEEGHFVSQEEVERNSAEWLSDGLPAPKKSSGSSQPASRGTPRTTRRRSATG